MNSQDTQILYAYLAGLIDGEGTVTLTKTTSSSKFRHPVLSMTSTTYSLLAICKDTFGGHISTQKVYKLHHKQSWSWAVKSDSAIVAIEKVMPFVREPEKLRRMNLILDKYKMLTKRNGKYSETEQILKVDFENDFFNHNL